MRGTRENVLIDFCNDEIFVLQRESLLQRGDVNSNRNDRIEQTAQYARLLFEMFSLLV